MLFSLIAPALQLCSGIRLLKHAFSIDGGHWLRGFSWICFTVAPTGLRKRDLLLLSDSSIACRRHNDVSFATWRDKVKKQCIPCPQLSLYSWSCIPCQPFTALVLGISMSGAVRVPGSSAGCTNNHCQALFYPPLARHTHHQFWVRSDDPDASSHPLLQTEQDTFWVTFGSVFYWFDYISLCITFNKKTAFWLTYCIQCLVL